MASPLANVGWDRITRVRLRMLSSSEVRRAFEDLDSDLRARCLALLCEPGLSHLRRYFADAANTTYLDSVVGLRHVVDVELAVRALAAIRSAGGIPSSSVLDSLLADYQEPMAAHQDDDSRITDSRAEYAYLSIYNLVRSSRNPTTWNLHGLSYARHSRWWVRRSRRREMSINF